LGEQEIELIRPASSNATPLSDGAVIPVAQTGQAVQIDDALNAMDAPTRAAMSVDLQQLGAAVSSRASDVNNSVPSLDQTVTDLRPLAQLAERRQQQVDRILSDVNTIMLALSDEEQQLGQVVDSGNTFFGAISTRDREFGTTLQQLNQLFGSLDSSLQGTTPAQRQALADAPATLAASQKMLSYLNPDVDRIIPEVLQAQVSYPSNQLNYAHPNAVTLAQEWESDFSQSDANGDAQRVTNITCTPLTCTSGNQSSTGPPAITMTQPTLIAGDPGLLLLDLLGGAS
jgi:ABC-type transporter Mla subunit MlaD